MFIGTHCIVNISEVTGMYHLYVYTYKVVISVCRIFFTLFFWGAGWDRREGDGMGVEGRGSGVPRILKWGRGGSQHRVKRGN